MIARTSMASLITRTRRLIGDMTAHPVPKPVMFRDEEIQNALDRLREEHRWVPLRPMPTYFPGGQILYLDYYADTPDWEDDVQLQDLTYRTIAPTTAELIVGHWFFAAQPQGIGVRATGKTYDLYGTSADLLETWATSLKLNSISVRTADEAANYAGQITNTLSLAAQYRARALPHMRHMYQGDAAPSQDGGGVTYPAISPIGS